MTEAARVRLASALGASTARVPFSTSRTAPASELRLEVRGIGPIELPVSRAQARRLCAIARPARYGRGEQTLLDRRVRDTWEIPKSRVKIDNRRFRQTLVPVLQRLGRDLGLADGRALRAELHSMLVYAPGQFFVEHQDSEKDDEMIGSLVVGLPSTFSGGTLHVRHGGETATYRGSKQALSFVAFYSDCRHEVKPVRSGHRVVLTYNLLLRGEATGAEQQADPELVGALAGCLQEHFASEATPDRLVYLLDHEYTRRSLGLERLKGVDASRARALLAAAELAGCEAVIALADVHETWSAYEPDPPTRWGHRRWTGWDDEDEDEDESWYERDAGEDDYELQELIDSEVTLDSWLHPRSGRAERVGLRVPNREVCASTPSGELAPYSSEYEGYMGNWGNTLERWYHRGALVLWPRSRAFAVRAQASPADALDELAARVRRRELAGAREAAAELAPFWTEAAARAPSRSFLTKALRTARLLEDADLAAMLLAPLRLEQLTPSHAAPLAALARAYGERFSAQLVAGWATGPERFDSAGPSREAWIALLPRLCTALREHEDAGAAVARLALGEAWKWTNQMIERALANSAPSHRERSLQQSGQALAAILDGAASAGAAELRDQAIGRLTGDRRLTGCAIALLHAVSKARWRALGLEPLVGDCASVLQARLARPPRAPGDWSIEPPAGCRCELCTELDSFLRDPDRTRFEWPLAEQRRRHIHGRIDGAELPVHHQTRRSGRPYTLVLTKTDTLFEREAQHRRQDERELAWLKRWLASGRSR
jgi:predicted 2-oxoglutarate/Fe(II)-dependent dioxygenase YbiX